MKLNLEVATIDDAQQAVRVLNSYIGLYANQLKEVEKVEVVKEEKPKVEKTVKVQVTVEDDSNEVEDDSNEVEETKPAPVKKEKAGKKVSVSTVSLTSKAKECIAKVGRDAVVKTISKYGERISAVDESDYEALDAELQSLLDEEV